MAGVKLSTIEKTLKNALGMFAFAIHDSKSNSLILARDRFWRWGTFSMAS